MSHVPACTQCGACCFSTLDTYVRVLGDDYARFGDSADRVSVFIGNRCYMRMLNGHCAQLAVDAAGRLRAATGGLSNAGARLECLRW